MRMRTHWLAAALLAAGLGVTATVHAQDYRLAFSKAENIEVFVEGATKDDWCAPSLNLRAVHGGAPDVAALARLMPRLGALFKQQCPQAADVHWRSVDAAGKPFAQGVSRAQDGWQVSASAPAPVPSASAAATDAASAAAPAATTPTPTPAQQASATQASTPATASASAAASSPTGSTTPPAIGLRDFAVANWQPPTLQQRVELASFMTTLKDQNGCQFLSVFNFGDQAAYMRLESEDVSCAANGYAQGKGRLRLMRSDGVQITRSGDLWFSDGMIFDAPVEGITRTDIVMARDEPNIWNQTQKVVWFGFASDTTSQSHYLLRAVLAQLPGGVGVWQLSQFTSGPVQIDILTAGSERFRQSDAIRAAIDAALRTVDNTIMPDARGTSLVFADDASAWQAGDQDKLLYEIRTERRMNSRTSHLGEWRYELQNARNHLFEREARLAERARREAERLAQQEKLEAESKERERVDQLVQLARAEQKNLRQYQELLQLEEGGGAVALRARLERDVSYQITNQKAYIRLMQGEQDVLQRIVRVDGSQADDATVDWPYPMRLIGQKSLQKGWYWITGDRRLDAAQRDDDGLPISLVTVTDEHACAENGCGDLLNPLGITRVLLNQADWTPQAAQALIDTAPKDRFLGW